MKPYFDPAVEIYLDKYKNHFPFPGFRDQEFREAFRKSVDNELLNYKNPDPDQARIIKTVIGLMKLV